MRRQELVELLLLAAVWGGSFIFIRIAVPEAGPIPLIFLRVSIAALILLPLALMRRKVSNVFRHWKNLTIVSLFNATLPFLLYAYAAQFLGAGFLSVSNAVTPVWGALIAWLWLKDPLSPSRIVGLTLSFLGILVLVWDKLSFHSDGTGLAVLATLCAPILYGIAASWTKKYLYNVDALSNTFGTMLYGSIALLPFAIWSWPETPISYDAWRAIIVLALVCTGFAYVMFFRLIRHIGPARAISVTFLVPVFGLAWGAVFLKEVITSNIVIGGSIILIGIVLALDLIKFKAMR